MTILQDPARESSGSDPEIHFVIKIKYKTFVYLI
jgi:hypothetical protein